ncbi:unnamed protein product [Caenorhabditis angaria]|uniref:Uncharacterized protein n=1 Tax=Caenorhabditis angaria TaxID=860376 RepID=A0A9P1IH25_9PELO|nr:unnamed protein product [Caenorhabditis angaria]
MSDSVGENEEIITHRTTNRGIKQFLVRRRGRRVHDSDDGTWKDSELVDSKEADDYWRKVNEVNEAEKRRKLGEKRRKVDVLKNVEENEKDGSGIDFVDVLLDGEIEKEQEEQEIQVLDSAETGQNHQEIGVFEEIELLDSAETAQNHQEIGVFEEIELLDSAETAQNHQEIGVFEEIELLDSAETAQNHQEIGVFEEIELLDSAETAQNHQEIGVYEEIELLDSAETAQNHQEIGVYEEIELLDSAETGQNHQEIGVFEEIELLESPTQHTVLQNEPAGDDIQVLDVVETPKKSYKHKSSEWYGFEIPEIKRRAKDKIDQFVICGIMEEMLRDLEKLEEKEKEECLLEMGYKVQKIAHIVYQPQENAYYALLRYENSICMQFVNVEIVKEHALEKYVEFLENQRRKLKFF